MWVLSFVDICIFIWLPYCDLGRSFKLTNVEGGHRTVGIFAVLFHVKFRICICLLFSKKPYNASLFPKICCKKHATPLHLIKYKEVFRESTAHIARTVHVLSSLLQSSAVSVEGCWFTRMLRYINLYSTIFSNFQVICYSSYWNVAKSGARPPLHFFNQKQYCFKTAAHSFKTFFERKTLSNNYCNY